MLKRAELKNIGGIVEIIETNAFERSVKRLHRNQIKDLDEAVKNIINNPNIGEVKVGDLAGVRVYKFRMVNQLTLLAYIYDELKNEIVVLNFAPHEHFYRNLKKQK